jgi:glycosyltransferase involved in cell wall biosynthesis
MKAIIKPTLRVNHIAPHIGGGVGSVLKNFFELSKNLGVTNSLYCLDRCKSNLSALSCLRKKKEGVILCSNKWTNIKKEIFNCDILLIHYWNHPLLAKFLLEARSLKNKIVIWCHNSGLFEPHIIPRYLTKSAQKIIFTSSCSFSAPNLQDLIKTNPKQFSAIHSVCALDKYFKLPERHVHKQKRKINLLYIGTVSGAKMHPECSNIFTKLSKSGFKINVVGGPDHSKLKRNVGKMGGKIKTFGEVKDVTSFYANADLFIYPLRKDHYGTGEQVILEAMAAGLPVVAFSNPAERAILANGAGSLVSKSTEFVKETIKLSNNNKYRHKIRQKAFAKIKNKLNSCIMVQKLVASLKAAAQQAGRRRLASMGAVIKPTLLELYAQNSFFDGEEFIKRIKKTPTSTHLLACRKLKKILQISSQSQIWRLKSKSTPAQYLRYLPNYKGSLMLKKANQSLKPLPGRIAL